MDRIIEPATPEEIIERAAALVGENYELRRDVDELRGRLREARRASDWYRSQYRAAMKYKFDAETNRARDSARFRELAVALVGLAVMVTCLAFVGAACWGWHFG